MRETKHRIKRPSSFTSINDFTEVLNNDQTKKKNSIKMESHSVISYITSEKYHFLNRDLSYESVKRSTSSLFYDLDELARTHGTRGKNDKLLHKPKENEYHMKKDKREPGAKLLPRDSIELNKKRKRNVIEPELSSDIEYLACEQSRNKNHQERRKKEKHYFDREITSNQQQKSNVKYKTELTKAPIEKKLINIEDPCPCQLFSYTCPCADSKPSEHKVTQASKSSVNSETRSRPRRSDLVKSSITTNTIINRAKQLFESHEQALQTAHCNNPGRNDDETVRCKPKSKQVTEIICPNCKQRIQIASTTNIDLNHRQNLEIHQTQTIKQRKKNYDEDSCSHDPRCDLIPVCQVFPIGKAIGKSSGKSSPRVIRITKACRHHPPCAVVPTCQKAAVIMNKVEYVPPCPHRPRCINLPICVPDIKPFNPNELSFITDKTDNSQQETQCMLCKCAEELQKENADIVSQQHDYGPSPTPNPNLCYRSNCMNNRQAPTSPTRYNMVPNTICAQCYNITHHNKPKICRSTKSCQYDNPLRDTRSMSDTVIFIRDVGCQFRNLEDGLSLSRTPSESFEMIDVKMDDYHPDGHTRRYEEKCTNPDLIYSTDSSVTCLSNVMTRQPSRATGFGRNMTYIAAYSTQDRLGEFFPSHIFKAKKNAMKQKYKKEYVGRKNKPSGNNVVSSRKCDDIYVRA